MLTIDGAMGEGGGQIIRTSLACSLITGTPFRITRIRAKRRKPGLMRQHLTAVKAAAELGHAELSGAEIGSSELEFKPRTVRPGAYHFAIGTAGSTMLVLQTVLPALLLADAPSELTLEGGTHNPLAPTFDFIEKAFLPLIRRMGPSVQATLVRHGFAPVGAGRVQVEIRPAPLEPFELLERGAIVRREGRVLLAHLPESIARREIRRASKRLGWEESLFSIEHLDAPRGPGNAVVLELESEHVTEVFAAIGERGKPAERVADEAAGELLGYLEAGVPVGVHLADQLLLPLALAKGGAFRTLRLSGHTRTQMEVLRRFLGVEFRVEEAGRDDVTVHVAS